MSVFYLFQPCIYVHAADGYLSAINNTSGEEINAGLQPQGMILCCNIGQCGPHIIDSHKAVDAEGGGKYP